MRQAHAPITKCLQAWRPHTVVLKQAFTHTAAAAAAPAGRASSPPQVQLQQHGSTGHTTLLLAAAAGEPPLMHRRLSAALCSEAAVKVARCAVSRLQGGRLTVLFWGLHEMSMR